MCGKGTPIKLQTQEHSKLDTHQTSGHPKIRKTWLQVEFIIHPYKS